MMAGTQVGVHQSLYRPWESSACRIHIQLSAHMYTGNTCIDVHTDREVDRPGQWKPDPGWPPALPLHLLGQKEPGLGCWAAQGGALTPARGLKDRAPGGNGSGGRSCVSLS